MLFVTYTVDCVRTAQVLWNIDLTVIPEPVKIINTEWVRSFGYRLYTILPSFVKASNVYTAC